MLFKKTVQSYEFIRKKHFSLFKNVFLRDFPELRSRCRVLHLAVPVSQLIQPSLTVREGFNPLSKPFPQSLGERLNRSSCRSHFGILDPSKGRDELFMLPHYTLRIP